MPNIKPDQKLKVVYELGILLQPLKELIGRTAPLTIDDYRIACAKVQSGDPLWRRTVDEFTTFSRDLKFSAEYNEISHIPERLWASIKAIINGQSGPQNLNDLFLRVKGEIERAEASMFP